MADTIAGIGTGMKFPIHWIYGWNSEPKQESHMQDSKIAYLINGSWYFNIDFNNISIKILMER